MTRVPAALPRAASYALLFAALAFIHARLAPYAFDDAYIHFRIARHLLDGGQPYFNAADPVMASSSSLWTVVLAGLFALGAGPTAVSILNAAFTTACVAVYARLIAGPERAPRALDHGLSALVVVPTLLPASTGLMETPLALLMVGAAMRLFQRDRPAAFFLFGLAIFLRLELAAFVAVFGVAALLARSMRWPAMAAYAALGIAPGTAYALHFFATLVPAAVKAKTVGYQISYLQALKRLVPPLADSVFFTDWMIASAAALVVGIVLLARPGRDLAARCSFAAALCVIAAYVAPRGFAFEWYLPLFALPLAWPLAAMLAEAAPGWRPTGFTRILSALAAALLCAPAVGDVAGYVQGAFDNPAHARNFLQGARVRRYLEVGRRLERQFPGAHMMTSEVGGLGYAFSGRIDDGFGVVSPAAVRYQPMRVPQERSDGSQGAIPPGFVREVDPQLIVSYDIFDQALVRSAAVNARYARHDEAPFLDDDVARARAIGRRADLWGIRQLHVWVRRDLPPPPL